MTRLDFFTKKVMFKIKFEKQLGIHGLSFHTQTFFVSKLLRFENVLSDSVLVAGIHKYFLTNFTNLGT